MIKRSEGVWSRAEGAGRSKPSTGGQNAAFAPAIPIMLQDSAKQMSDSVLLKATSEIIPGVGALKT